MKAWSESHIAKPKSHCEKKKKKSDLTVCVFIQVCKAIKRQHTEKNIFFALPKSGSIKESSSKSVHKADLSRVPYVTTSCAVKHWDSGASDLEILDSSHQVCTKCGLGPCPYVLRAPQGRRNAKGDCFAQIRIKAWQPFRSFQVCLNMQPSVDLTVSQIQRKYMQEKPLIRRISQMLQ